MFDSKMFKMELSEQAVNFLFNGIEDNLSSSELEILKKWQKDNSNIELGLVADESDFSSCDVLGYETNVFEVEFYEMETK